MRELNSEVVTRPNAWGRDQTYTETVLEVEREDVGRAVPHYLGHNHREHSVRIVDVGRQIERLRDGKGWTCWSFRT